MSSCIKKHKKYIIYAIFFICSLSNVACINIEDDREYRFLYGDLAIELNAPSDEVVESLGEPLSYYETYSCDNEGISRMYTYKYFDFDTYSFEGKDYIKSITLKSDMYGTEEGIYIGDNVGKVLSVYGKSDNKNNLTYRKNKMELHFIVVDECVASIEYLLSD